MAQPVCRSRVLFVCLGCGWRGRCKVAWNTPRTFTTGEVITATILNTNIRDNLNASAAGVASAVGDVFYASAANTIAPLSLGSIYQVLAVNGAGTIPFWSEAYAPIDIVTADTEVVNTTTETDIYTSSDIGGNLLGTTGAIKIFFLISYLNNSGVGIAFTLKIKLDSTTIFTPINLAAHGTSANRRLGWMIYTMSQKGSADSQQHAM